jgi:hypothetical protein
VQQVSCQFVHLALGALADHLAHFDRFSNLIVGNTLLAGLAKVVLQARVAVRAHRAAHGNQFTDSIIEFHTVLSPFIHTDEVTPKKDTVQLYDARGRERLESKADLAARGIDPRTALTH